MLNSFHRGTLDGSLDREYLRTCAVYRLLKSGRIGRAKAASLLTCAKNTRVSVVEMWKSGPLPNMKP